MLTLYVLVALACAAIGLAIWLWPTRGPRCHCGQPGAYLRSDGSYECDDCVEKRLSGKAPKGG